MSIERELLKRVISGDDDGDFFISHRLYKDIETFLAQPEQEPTTRYALDSYWNQEVYQRGYAEAKQPESTAEAIMPNGVRVSNVYDAYEEGRKSVMSEQEPVAWKVIYKTNGEFMFSSVKPTKRSYKYDVVIPLYLTPPKREPLGLEIADVCGSEDYREGFKDGALYAEKCHGTGGGE